MKYLFFTLSILALTACGGYVQNTSGSDYVLATDKAFIDEDIAQAAAVEPDLRFPARIGIARIVNGQLTLPPTGEVALFSEVAERNARFGDFIPVSPLVVALIHDGNGENLSAMSRSGRIVKEIRLAAARQHLDYVIIYEVGASSRTENTPFALADVTLLGGMLLPTRNIAVAGMGVAAFIDVRNGYPYGTAQTTTDLSGFARSFQAGSRSEALRDRAILKVAQALVPDIEDLLVRLAE